MLPKQPMNGSGPRTIVIRFFLVVTLLNYNIPNSMTSLVEHSEAQPTEFIFLLKV